MYPLSLFTKYFFSPINSISQHQDILHYLEATISKKKKGQYLLHLELAVLLNSYGAGKLSRSFIRFPEIG
jgi:hypothetical protein